MKNINALTAASMVALLSTPLFAQESAGTIPANVTFAEYCTVTNAPTIDFTDALPGQVSVQTLNVQMECAVSSDTAQVRVWASPVTSTRGDAVVFTKAGVNGRNVNNWLHGYDQFSFRANDGMGPEALVILPSSGINQYSFSIDATLLNTETSPNNLGAPFYNEDFAGAATVYIEFVKP